jgi:hypothetical protein
MSRGRRIPRTFSRPVVWSAASVALAAAVVQVTRGGVDVLAVAVAGFLLLVLERTAGDWIADTVGGVPVVVLVVGIAALGLAYVQTPGGRAYAGRLFAVAEARGYHTSYFRAEPASAAIRPSPGSVHAPAPSSARETTRAPRAVDSTDHPADPPSPRAGTTAEARAPHLKLGRLRIVPELAVTDREVAFTVDAQASAGNVPDVEFSVDGRPVGRSEFVDGVATLPWRTRVPGRYTVRVRFVDGYAGSGISASLNVLPAGR